MRPDLPLNEAKLAENRGASGALECQVRRRIRRIPPHTPISDRNSCNLRERPSSDRDILDRADPSP